MITELEHIKTGYNPPRTAPMKVGITFGAFDLLHPGHLIFFENCKRFCDILIVGLHVDPNTERKNKNKPIETVEERMIRLKGCRYVNAVFAYDTEEDCAQSIIELKPHIRFMGDDWQGKEYTGKKECEDLGVEVMFFDRKGHGYSSTALRERIKKS